MKQNQNSTQVPMNTRVGIISMSTHVPYRYKSDVTSYVIFSNVCHYQVPFLQPTAASETRAVWTPAMRPTHITAPRLILMSSSPPNTATINTSCPMMVCAASIVNR